MPFPLEVLIELCRIEIFSLPCVLARRVVLIELCRIEILLRFGHLGLNHCFNRTL